MNEPPVLAEVEVFHSRPIAPTRRLALGGRMLPLDRSPGAGTLLLAGILARYGPALNPDDFDIEDLEQLAGELERGQRIVQPRLRYRLQVDRIGLLRSSLRLVAGAQGPEFRFSDQGDPLVFALAGLYAAGSLLPAERPAVFACMRKGLSWRGPIGPDLIAYLGARTDRTGWTSAQIDPLGWALTTLGFSGDAPKPSKDEVRRAYRQALMSAHPDHGGDYKDAADRIAELSEARRLLSAG